MTFFAEHRQQTTAEGCLYYSAAVVSGHHDLIEHAADTSAPRYYLRLLERGLLPFVLFCSEPPNPCTSRSYWERLRERFTRDNRTDQQHAPLLVALKGSTEGWLHQVALLIPVKEGENTVHVSDSNYAEPHAADWETFLDSQYACAHRVEILGPAELDAYPPQIHAQEATYDESRCRTL